MGLGSRGEDVTVRTSRGAAAGRGSKTSTGLLDGRAGGGTSPENKAEGGVALLDRSHVGSLSRLRRGGIRCMSAWSGLRRVPLPAEHGGGGTS